MFFHDASQGYAGHRIRRVELANGVTTTLAGDGTPGSNDGNDGIGVSATFNYPMGVAIAPSGNFALVGVRARPPLPRVAPTRADGAPRLAHAVQAIHRFSPPPSHRAPA